MLQRKPSSNKLITPAIQSHSNIHPRQRWKQAETRVAVISYPKANRQRRKENKSNKVIETLPVIEAELEKEIDYFEKFLEKEIPEAERKNELEKFIKFCSIDSEEESMTYEYFMAKSRQFLKQRQLGLILDNSLVKRKEVEILDQLAAQSENQTKVKRKNSIIERNYQSLVKDFARFSFELCSLKSLEHANLAAKNTKKIKKNPESRIQRTLVQREIIKEEGWIKVLEENIRNIV